MSTAGPAIASSASEQRATYAALLLPVFALTIFVSATLLFSVQPMFTKMVLPLLGGSPSVWSVAMVFFQGVLLIGYGYAHLLIRYVDPRRVAVVHLIFCAAAFAALPIAVADLGKPPIANEAIWLLGLFGASIGLPFFAVSANAPLLQAWFARTTHAQASDPYFLYGASNLGSFFALLAYPILFEPFLTLRDQSGLWSAAFVFLILLLIGSALLMGRNMRPGAADERAATSARSRPSWTERCQWMALAFVPSGMLIAVTSHISTDIASAPFLWVIPLALYLLTFVLTFRHGGEVTHRWMVLLQPFFVAPLVVGLMAGERAYWLVAILLSIGVFVISTMVCHRELYLRRPGAEQLTGFYMWVSAGGVLGGIFSGLVAPYVFLDVWEFPILIVLALLCRPGAFAQGWRSWMRDAAVFPVFLVIVIAPLVFFHAKLPSEAELAWMIFIGAIGALIMVQAQRPSGLVGWTVLALILTAAYRPGIVQTETERSFFGVHKVVESADGRFRMLYHGTTLHGAQRIRDDDGRPVAGRPEPLTYYYDGGLLSELIKSQQTSMHPLQRVAVVGLGAGSLACYAKPSERWTYFEIDPVVVRIARDAAKFRFLADCAPQADVVLGDARLTLAEAGVQYDLIVLDAFSSDVVPVHLLTREALGVYLARLAPNGVIAMHISNRYLDLASVVREVAALQGLNVYLKRDGKATADGYQSHMHANSLVAVLARHDADVARLVMELGWTRLEATGSVRPWTDDYSNILSAIWRMRFPG
jgi:hypothetical protein